MATAPPTLQREPHTIESIQKLIDLGYTLYPSDQLTYFLKLAIAVKLRESPEAGTAAINQTLENIRSLEKNGKKTSNDYEWESILTQKSAHEIADILESNSDESQRLRSNFQGYGIISEEKRKEIIHHFYHEKRVSPSQIFD